MTSSSTQAPRSGSLPLRLLSAAVGLPLVVASIWYGGWLLLAFGIIVALAGLWEFRKITAPTGTLSLSVAGLATVGFMVAAWRGQPLAPTVLVALVVGSLLWHLGRHIWRPEADSGLASWALTLTGALYLGALLSFGLAIRGLEYPAPFPYGDGSSGILKPPPPLPDYGRNWLLLSILVTFASDTGAYLFGRALGRHRLAPRLSPGKTWEGAFGGLVAAAVAFGGLTSVLDLPADFHLGAALGLGFGLSFIAQAGDLAESFLKRAGGVKEAGWLVPGHGGILDRLDSVVLVLPAAYYGLVWLT